VKTRGVVLTVAILDTVESSMTWLGVGNVEGRLLRTDAGASHPRESVLLRGGLVGYQLPALQASVIPVAAGDLLILATDGIHTAFEEGINLNETPRQIADKILAGTSRETMTRWCSSRVIMEGNMNNPMHRLARFYAVTLQKYLENEQEAILEHAYELGRTAIAQELGVLDVARIHQEALGKMLGSPAAKEATDDS